MTMEFNSDFALWLCETYKPCTKEERDRPMRLLDILILYEDHCKQEQTYPLHPEYIVRILKRLFPDSRHSFVHMNSRRYPAYTNICAVDPPKSNGIHINDEAVSASSDENNNLTITVPTLHIVNGKNVEIKLIFNKSSLDIFVNGSKMENRLLEIPVKVKCTQSVINSLIHLMKSIVICRGKQIKSVKDVKPKTNGIVEEWKSVYNNETELRLRSLKCKLVVGWSAKNDAKCTKCSKILQIKKKSAVTEGEINVEDSDVTNDKVETEQYTSNADTHTTEAGEEATIEEKPADIENTHISEDHDNLIKMLERSLQQGIPNEFKELLRSQLSNLNCNKDPRYRRWDKCIIKICLSIYSRSPLAYRELRDSGMLLLPSPRLMRLYNQPRSEADQEHLQGMHSEDGPVDCIEEISTEDNLQEKEGRMLPQYMCYCCNKAFPDGPSLEIHRMVNECESSPLNHTSFNCGQCRKRFVSDEELTVHMSLHTGNGNTVHELKCGNCSRIFRRLGNLKVHVKSCNTPMANTVSHAQQCGHVMSTANQQKGNIHQEDILPPILTQECHSIGITNGNSYSPPPILRKEITTSDVNCRSQKRKMKHVKHSQNVVEKNRSVESVQNPTNVNEHETVQQKLTKRTNCDVQRKRVQRSGHINEHTCSICKRCFRTQVQLHKHSKSQACTHTSRGCQTQSSSPRSRTIDKTGTNKL